MKEAEFSADREAIAERDKSKTYRRQGIAIGDPKLCCWVLKVRSYDSLTDFPFSRAERAHVALVASHTCHGRSFPQYALRIDAITLSHWGCSNPRVLLNGIHHRHRYLHRTHSIIRQLISDRTALGPASCTVNRKLHQPELSAILYHEPRTPENEPVRHARSLLTVQTVIVYTRIHDQCTPNSDSYEPRFHSRMSCVGNL